MNSAAKAGPTSIAENIIYMVLGTEVRYLSLDDILMKVEAQMEPE